MLHLNLAIMVKDKLNIGIIGCFQNGKSTFINCLLDDIVARTGYGISTTSINTKYIYGEVQKVEYCSNGEIVGTSRLNEFLKMVEYPQGTDEIVITLWKPLLKNINIIDTPGFEANDEDNIMALSSLDNIDIAIIVLTNKGISIQERNIIVELFKRRIPYFLIMNCTDSNTWNPNSKSNIIKVKNLYENLKSVERLPWPIDGHNIVSVNLLWFWYASEQYINEITDERRSQIETAIESYSDNMGEKLDREFFLNASNFLIVRNFLAAEINGNISLKTLRWKIALNKNLIEWSNKLNSIVLKY